MKTYSFFGELVGDSAVIKDKVTEKQQKDSQCRKHMLCSLPDGHIETTSPSRGCLIRDLTGDSW